MGIATPAVLTANLAEGCNGYISSVVLQVGLSGGLDPVGAAGGLVLATCSALLLTRVAHPPPLCATQHDLVPRFSVYNIFALKQVSIDAVGRRHLHPTLRLPCKPAVLDQAPGFRFERVWHPCWACTAFTTGDGCHWIHGQAEEHGQGLDGARRD